MRIFLIIENEVFFLPDYTEAVVRQLKSEVIGISPVLAQESSFKKIKKYFRLFGFVAFFVLSLKILWYRLLDLLSFFIKFKHCYSIKGVARRYNLPIYPTKDVNLSNYLETVKKLEPDVILSSCGQIFKKELLSVPKLGCINRHTGLLPKYRGLLPVYWALANGEKEIGVTIHFMKKEIDAGDIITQEKIEIKPNDTLYSLYQKGYDLSVKLTLEALDKIESKEFTPVKNSDVKGFYFSFPDAKAIKSFRKAGYRII